MVCSVASKRIAETPVRRFIDSLYRRDYASAGPRTRAGQRLARSVLPGRSRPSSPMSARTWTA